jgi:hypothetical protein
MGYPPRGRSAVPPRIAPTLSPPATPHRSALVTRGWAGPVTVVCDDIDTVGTVFGEGFTTYRSGRTTIVKSDTVLVTADSIDRTVEVRVLGDPDAVDAAIATLTSAFTPVPVRVKWMYKGNGESVKLPIRSDNLPRSEFYPALAGEPLTDYYDRFMASGSNVLVLIGPPGTGKTSFHPWTPPPHRRRRHRVLRHLYPRIR